MKLSRILPGILLVCVAACSSPTAPGLPTVPTGEPSPALPTDPIPPPDQSTMSIPIP